MIVRIFIWIIIFNCAVAQQDFTEETKVFHIQEAANQVGTFAEQNLITKGELLIRKAEQLEYERFMLIKQKQIEGQSFDLVSSFGSNIGFGGFHDRYAVVNFTPQLDVNPVSFLNVKCRNNLSCYVPIKGIKEYYKTVFAQGIAMLVIDNSLKLISSSSNWILETAAYITKNLLINFLIKPQVEKSERTSIPMLEYEYQFYSVTIRF